MVALREGRKTWRESLNLDWTKHLPSEIKLTQTGREKPVFSVLHHYLLPSSHQYLVVCNILAVSSPLADMNPL